MIPSTYAGSVTGTGAAINIELGYQPDYVRLTNQTTGRSLTWFRSMPAGYGEVAGAMVTTGGVSAYNGAPTAGNGMTIGTDAINTAGQVIAILAIRSGPGSK